MNSFDNSRTYTKVFQNPEKKEELARLLKEGYSYASLGRYFGVDHTSVIWHARKLGIESGRGEGKTMEPPRPRKMKVPKMKEVLAKQKEKIVVVDGERVNRGLDSYADYLKVENERRRKQGLPETNSPPPEESGEEISIYS